MLPAVLRASSVQQVDAEIWKSRTRRQQRDLPLAPQPGPRTGSHRNADVILFGRFMRENRNPSGSRGHSLTRSRSGRRRPAVSGFVIRLPRRPVSAIVVESARRPRAPSKRLSSFLDEEATLSHRPFSPRRSPAALMRRRSGLLHVLRQMLPASPSASPAPSSRRRPEPVELDVAQSLRRPSNLVRLPGSRR